MNTARFGIAAALFVAGALLFSGGAFAVTTSAVSASQTSSFSQTIDIPRDNVLAALALGLHGSRALSLVSNIDRVGSFERFFDRNIDLDDDDTLLLLALSRRGGFDLFDDSLGFRTGSGIRSLSGLGLHDFDDFRTFDLDDDFVGDLSFSTSVSRSVHQRVDFDEDDVLLALALGRGSLDIEDIADIEFSSVTSIERAHDVDIDDDDVLLWLALR